MARRPPAPIAVPDEPVPEIQAPQPPRQPNVGAHLIEDTGAPYLYFDAAPTFGIYNGICHITLEAARFISKDNKVVTERILVGHLRMSVRSAQSLKQAVDQVVLMAMKAAGGAH